MSARNSPFVGLIPYDEVSKRYFCARDSEIEMVTAKASVSRLTVFYGPSGAGKSSILGAGLVPRLRTGTAKSRRIGGLPATPLTVSHREWAGDPWKALCCEVAAALKSCGLKAIEFPRAWLPGAAAEADDDAPSERPRAPMLVLVLDQFEELFIQHPEITHTPAASLLALSAHFSAPEARPPFRASPGQMIAAALIAMLNSPASPVNVVLSLREDSLASLDVFKGIVQGLFSTLLRIDRLDDTAVRTAVTVPLERWGEDHGAKGKFKAGGGLVEALLADSELRLREPVRGVALAPRFEAPFLQIVLERLWQEDIANWRLQAIGGELRATTFAALGKGQGIRQQFVEGALRHRLAKRTRLFWFIEATRLLVSRTQKFPWIASELAGEIAGPLVKQGIKAPSGEQLADLLRGLAEDRLVRELAFPERDEDKAPWDGRFEVAHDSLAGDIYRWRVEESATLEQVERQRLATKADRDKRRFATIASLIFVAGMLGAGFFYYWRQAETLRLANADLKTARETADAEALAAREARTRTEAALDEASANNVKVSSERNAFAAEMKGLRESITAVFSQDDLHQIRAKLSTQVSDRAFDESSELAREARRLLDPKGTHEGGLIEVALVRAELASHIEFLKRLEDAFAKLTDVDPNEKQRLAASLTEVQTLHGQLDAEFKRLAAHEAAPAAESTADLTAAAPAISLSSEPCSVEFAARGPWRGRLLAASTDGVVQFFDTAGAAVRKGTFRANSRITMAVLSADGTRAAVACEDSNVYRIDLTKARLLPPYTFHEGKVTCVAFSPDASKLASTDSRLHAYGWESMSPAVKSSDFKNLSWVAFDHVRDDIGPRIVCSRDDGFVCVYDYDEHRILWPPIPVRQNHAAYLGAPVRRAVFSPRDRWVLASAERQAFLFPITTGTPRTAISPPPLASNGATADKPIVWRAMFKPRPALADPLAFRAISFERDLILLCCDDGSGRLYTITGADMPAPTEVGRLLHDRKAIHRGPVRTAAWWRNLDANLPTVLVALASDDSTASLWQIDGEGPDPATKPKVTLLGVARGHTGPIREISIDPDGKILATGSDDKTVRLWKTGR